MAYVITDYQYSQSQGYLQDINMTPLRCNFYFPDLSFNENSKIRVDNQNNAWIINDQGLRIIKSNGEIFSDEFILDELSENLLSNVINDIAFDDRGYTYIGTDKGISIFESILSFPFIVVLLIVISTILFTEISSRFKLINSSPFSFIPVLIIFFCWVFKIEKTNFYQILGVIFSLLGVVVIVTKADLGKLLNLNFNKGDLWMVVAMFSWAIYSAFLRKKKLELSHIAFLQTIITVGLIFLLPAYMLEVMLALSIQSGVSPADLEELRVKKAASNGAFDEHIFLEHVSDVR